MKTSGAGIALITKHEGCHLNAYQCPAGVWTIGYGHTGNVCPGMIISPDDAINLLRYDLRNAENAVERTGIAWTQEQFDALVSFTFNCGEGNLRKLIRNRTNREIIDAIPKYNKANGVVLSGLIRRRAEEQALFKSGTQDAEDQYWYPEYTGNSRKIDEVLEAIGATADYDYTYTGWKRRHWIAEANGMKSYRATANENLHLIQLAKDGILRRVRHA